MKIKFFILMVLFMGIGVISYAQSTTSAPAEKKDAPAQVTTPEKGKTGECQGHQSTEMKAACKWVDVNNDGKCDNCGKTEKECNEKCAPASEPKKEGCAASCPMHKECGESSGTKPSK